MEKGVKCLVFKQIYLEIKGVTIGEERFGITRVTRETVFRV